MNTPARLFLIISLLALLALFPGGASQVLAGKPWHLASFDNELEEIDEFKVAVPVALKRFCGNFFDDFGKPNSGWYVGEDEYQLAAFLSGEYRTVAKSDEYVFLYLAPTCVMEAYILEVDARWEGKVGDSYNLIFEILGDYEYYYLFSVNTDYQGFLLAYRSPAGWIEVIPPTFTYAIHPGLDTNHLKVIYLGTEIILEANGYYLGAAANFQPEEPGEVGVAVIAYDGEPGADARFDNFRLTRFSSTIVSGISSDGLIGKTGETSAWQPALIWENRPVTIHH